IAAARTAARQQLVTQSSFIFIITQSTAATNAANTESSQQTMQNSQFLLTRLNYSKMCETAPVHGIPPLSTLVREESLSSDKDEQGA
ncbi:hypothetical protein EI555_019663, partial [Monodon monoceros]